LSAHFDVELADVAKAPSTITDPFDPIVVGGPTHALSMTRQSTREDAFRQGASHRSAEMFA